MNLTFANPALLIGAALFVVPLIIHLLNRRRFVPIRWAAQEFLLQAYQQTRRRLTLESLLLLLARCLLIILIALALARPFAPSDNLLKIFTAKQRSVVIVIDTSYSMTRSGPGVETALDRAREQARQLIDQLSTERGDKISLLTLSSRPQLLLHESARADLARDAIARLKPDWKRADLLRTIETLDELVLAPAQTHREVFFFTDLQKLTFDPSDPSTRQRSATGEVVEASAAPAFRRASARDAEFTVIDVGAPESPRNLSVESLSIEPRNAVAGGLVNITAAVRNHGGSAQQGVTGTFVFNGQREQGKLVTFDVPAKGVSNVEFTATARDAGYSTVEFEISPDDLTADDRRAIAFPVRDSVAVLLVDGKDDRDPALSATGQLAQILNPDPERGGTPYRLTTLDDRRFNLGAENVQNFDLIVLANVSSIDEKMAKELDDAVRSGAGLLVFLGDLVDIRAWNERLWREDGSGLLPGRLLEARGDAQGDVSSAFYPKVDDLEHPIVRLFREASLTTELRQAVLRYFPVEVGPNDTATVTALALDDDPVKPSPLILEKPAGHGRVVLVTTSADRSFTRLPDEIVVYLSLIHEMAAFLTLPDLAEFNLLVGDRIRRTERAIPSALAMVLPSNERVPLEMPDKEPEHGRYLMPQFDRTVDPGVYTLELEFPLASAAGTSAGAREQIRYAVNLDVAESELERLTPNALAALYPGVSLKLLDRVEAAAKEATSSHEGELWKPLVYALLALLALEMAMAAWFGRQSLGGRT